MWTYIILAIVAVGARTAQTDCVGDVQQCYDENYYVIRYNIDHTSGEYLQDFVEVCEVQERFYQCLDQLGVKCANAGNDYENKKNDLTTKVESATEGICVKNGGVDRCVMDVVNCTSTFMNDVRPYADKPDVENYCAEAAVLNSCLDKAAQYCPDSLVSGMKSTEAFIIYKSSVVGCDANCLEAMNDCVYALQVSTDDDYCTAYKNGTTCLNQMLTVKACEDQKSQDYLNKAVNLRTSVHKGTCNAGNSAISHASLLSTLVVLMSALILNRW